MSILLEVKGVRYNQLVTFNCLAYDICSKFSSNLRIYLKIAVIKRWKKNLNLLFGRELY